MVSTEESFQQTQDALDVARLERARALQQVQTLCETGRRHLVIPFLMANMQRVPALRKIRLWQLDSIMFNTSRRIANKTIRVMRETINDDSSVNDGYVTLGWALESKEKTVRMIHGFSNCRYVRSFPLSRSRKVSHTRSCISRARMIKQKRKGR